VRKKVPTVAAFINTLAPPLLFMPAIKDRNMAEYNKDNNQVSR
jgi:hypothetical protein